MDRFWGQVLEVYDGDTLVVDVSSQSARNTYPYRDVERVRLRGFNAPELNEPGGVAARARLARLVQGRRVGVKVSARDKFGRIIGEVEDP